MHFYQENTCLLLQFTLFGHFKNVSSLNLPHFAFLSRKLSYEYIVPRRNLSHSDDVSNIKSHTFTCFVFFILKLSLNDMCKFPDV